MQPHRLDREENANLYQDYEKFRAERGEPNSILDQYALSVDSVLASANLANQRGDIAKRRILLIGDADLLSVAFSLIAEPLEMVILDLDERLADVAYELLEENMVNCRFVLHDMRMRLLAVVRNHFDTIVSEPPPTDMGIEIALNRGIQSASKKGAIMYVTIPSTLSPVLDSKASEMGLNIEEKLEGFNKYDAAHPKGYETTDLVRIHIPGDAEARIPEHYFGPLYSHDESKSPQLYRCKCGNKHAVGVGEAFESYEELLASGCPDCGWSKVFVFDSDIPFGDV